MEEAGVGNFLSSRVPQMRDVAIFMITVQYFVYILTNQTNRVLYIGVTNNLIRRIHEHKEHLVNGFTDQYNVTKLVYFEVCSDITEAILHEKQLKGRSRIYKLKLIQKDNSEFLDLYNELL